MDDTGKTFPDLCEEHGVAVLAEVLGVTEAYVYMLRAGHRACSRGVLEKLRVRYPSFSADRELERAAGL